MSRKITEAECQKCNEGLMSEIRAIRREIKLAVGVSTGLITIFIGILALIIKGN